MPEHGNERIRVDADPQRCYEVAIDFERYPQWARDVKEVAVLERDDDGRGTRVEYRVAAMGKSVRYTLAYDYSDAPNSFNWHFVEGEMIKMLEGEYRFEPDDGGTRVHYDLTVEQALPMPGFMKRKVAGMILGTALKELKKEAESGGAT